jgi:hypothetical protein
MFERIASRADGVCLDIGHVIISTYKGYGRGNIDAELERWLTSLRGHLGELRLSATPTTSSLLRK